MPVPEALLVILCTAILAIKCHGTQEMAANCPAPSRNNAKGLSEAAAPSRELSSGTSQHMLLQLTGQLSRFQQPPSYHQLKDEVPPRSVQSDGLSSAAGGSGPFDEDANFGFHDYPMDASEQLPEDTHFINQEPLSAPDGHRTLDKEAWGSLLTGVQQDMESIRALLLRHPPITILSTSSGNKVGHRSTNITCSFADDDEKVCKKMMRHTCQDIKKLPELCPKSCGYVLLDPLFACNAACVAKEDCKLGGRTLGFYDNETHRCGQGPIQGCLHYDADHTCGKCSRLFLRSKDGQRCHFLPGYKQSFSVVFTAVVVVLLVLLPLNIYRWVFKSIGNDEVLSYGWRHRRRLQASTTTYDDPTRPPVMYPWSTSMHDEIVAGGGLCLFYNALGFLILVSLAVAITTTIIRAATSSPDIEHKESCTIGSTEKKFETAVDDLVYYHKVAAIGIGALWVFLFAYSVYWARSQHLAFRMLDRKTDLMSDFGLKVDGLPVDATEIEISRYFERLAPGAIVGTSLAYDYQGHSQLVAKCTDHHIRLEEWRMGQTEIQEHPTRFSVAGLNPYHPYKDKDGTSGRKRVSHVELKPMQESDLIFGEDQDLIVSVLRGLQCSGVAFVVCHTEDLKEKLIKRFQQEARPRFRGNPIRVSSVQEEPCCFYWENFIYNRSSHLLYGAIEIGVLLIELIALGIVVYWPAAYYIFHRLMGTGSDSSTAVVMMLGLCISLMNGIMFFLVDISSRRVGFYYKVDVDICNLVGCTVIVGLQTFFNLAVTYFAVKSVDLSMSSSLFSEQSQAEDIARTESEHRQMAEKLWNLLVPGILILPDLLGRLFKYVLSAKAMAMFYIYVPFVKQDLRTNKNVTPWEAEEQLQPAPMQVEFDYANNITMTSTAFMILFFNTPYACWTCWILVGWVCLSYVTLKYCHLRFNKVVEYTSYHLDDCSILLWGIPLSLIAAAAAYWTAAWKRWPWWTTLAAFGASLILYFFTTLLVLAKTTTFDTSGKSEYIQAQEHLCYNYFNTNPIQVLKSQYLHEGPPLTFFVRGKEYLQRNVKANWDNGSDDEGQFSRAVSKISNISNSSRVADVFKKGERLCC